MPALVENVSINRRFDILVTHQLLDGADIVSVFESPSGLENFFLPPWKLWGENGGVGSLYDTISYGCTIAVLKNKKPRLVKIS